MIELLANVRKKMLFIGVWDTDITIQDCDKEPSIKRSWTHNPYYKITCEKVKQR
jgi:hypothetical protein